MLLDLADEVEQLLGAADGEGGDDDVAALGKGLVENHGEVLGVGAFALVVAVAVGGFGDDIVRLGDVLGIADDRLI